MSNEMNMSLCRMGCWGFSAGVGIVSLYFVAGETGFIAALLVAIALAVFLALVLIQLVCWVDDNRQPDLPYTPDDVPGPPQPNPQYSASAMPTAPGAGTPAGSGGGVGPTAAVAAEAATAKAAAAKAAASPDAKASETATDTGAAAHAPASTGAAVKSGTLLKGEQEIATSKGEWSYDGGAGQAKPAAASTPDADKGAADAATGEGTRPEALEGPRAGQADNLKEIKGVGPKLEKLLHELGFYHFDQIAGWSADEIAWVDANLQGFKGRVSRDDWVAQAKVLASGGETEFSKRVDEGDVY